MPSYLSAILISALRIISSLLISYCRSVSSSLSIPPSLPNSPTQPTNTNPQPAIHHPLHPRNRPPLPLHSARHSRSRLLCRRRQALPRDPLPRPRRHHEPLPHAHVEPHRRPCATAHPAHYPLVDACYGAECADSCHVAGWWEGDVREGMGMRDRDGV